jgi:hypothetical protein
MISSTPIPNPGVSMPTAPIAFVPPTASVQGKPQQATSSRTTPSKVSQNEQPTVGGRHGCITLVDYHSEFSALASSSRSGAAYWRAAVRRIAGQASILGFVMHGQHASESIADFACVEEIPPEAKQAFRQLLQQVAMECECQATAIYRTGIQIHHLSVAVIAIPLQFVAPLELRATMVFAMRTMESRELALPAERLQSLLLQAVTHFPTADPRSKETSETAKTLEKIGQVATYRDTRELTYALVGALAGRYDCTKVALGLVQDCRVRVLAISGMDQFKPSSPGVIDVQQAMEEAYDCGVVACGQTAVKTSQGKTMPIHQRWSATSRSAIVTVPIAAEDDIVAVVTFQRDPNRPFTDADISGLQTLLRPFGPAIALSVRGDRRLGEHLKDLVRKTVAQVGQPRTKLGRLARTIAVAATLVFCFGWMPYRPSAACMIVPANMNQSIASFDMKLSEALVRSGDVVQAGQILARFDTRELELERARLLANRNQSEVEVRRALAIGDAASAALAKASSRAFQCQLDTVQSKINDCTLKAPAAGMVLEADLSTKIGQVFPQGEQILSFAPMDQWELHLHVPERMARFIRSDQQGSFAPIATPGVKHSYRIENVSGATEVIDGKNVIIAKAAIDGAPAELRHGMKGIARTSTGWRPVCWVALHGAYEFLCDVLWL